MPHLAELLRDQRFVVGGEVGRGGVGVVYRAFDSTLLRDVALKVIAVRAIDTEEQARFLREGRLLSSLSHPHIVRSFSSGLLDSGLPYVAMEWLDGEDLAARLRRAPLPLRDALEIARQVALALAAAHEARVIHRDIKPSNVFLLSGQAEPFVKVVDFGVAADRDVRLTQTGVMIGTPSYMPPEQARGAAIDARADLYSLGATLFELVSGRPPHLGTTPIAVLAKLVTVAAPRLSELVPEVPKVIDALVARLLETEPSDRPPSAASVATALADALSSLDAQVLARAPAPPRESLPPPGGTRLVTALVALGVGEGDAQRRALSHLRDHGADAIPLGKDSLVARFGARHALGDEGERALSLGHELSSKGARIGIATGRTQVDLTRPSGKIVELAAALAHKAGPGRALADATTAELSKGRLVLVDDSAGSFVVKRAAEISSAIVLVRRERTPFVGREPELARAFDAYERCVDDETPIVVTLAGAPGIGKSRLGRELVSRIVTHDKAAKIAVARGEPFARRQPFGIARGLVRAFLSLPRGATLDDSLRALEAAWPEPEASPSTSQPRPFEGESGREAIARLLAGESFPEGVDPRAVRDILWLSLTRFVLGLAACEPAVLVVDDLQWADDDSIAWLDHLLGRGGSRPLFILGTARPAFFGEHPSRFAGRDHVRIELRPLSRRASGAIARAVLGGRADDEQIERLTQRAGGSPLFAEELARLVLLGRETAQAVTIESAIQVSLDALDEDARAAMTQASVLGDLISEASLEALGIARAGVLLDKLVTAELLVEKPASSLDGSREFAFKHGLARDVAYASLGADEKPRLHALAGRWLEAQGADSAVVAHHLDLGQAHVEAAVHWERAARHALSTHALADAVRMAESALAFARAPEESFTRALLLDDAYSRLDPRAAERESAVHALEHSSFDEASHLRAKSARARYEDARGGGPEVTARLASALADAIRLGLTDEQARLAATLASRQAFAGALSEAESVAQALLDLSQKPGLTPAAIDAWQTLAVIRQTRGELADALEARKNAVRAARVSGPREREAMLTINVGFALTTIGASGEARTAIERGLTLARGVGSSGTVRHGLMVLLGWAVSFGSDEALDKELAELRKDADAAASGGWIAPDRTSLGVLFYRGAESLRVEGGAERARVLLEKTAALYREMGHQDIMPVALGLWAEAERLSGNPRRAIDLAEGAATRLEDGAPSLLNEAPIFLALHDAYLDLGDSLRARDAVARGLPYLDRRATGLSGTSYAEAFLTQLPYNAGLLAAAEGYRLARGPRPPR